MRKSSFLSGMIKPSTFIHGSFHRIAWTLRYIENGIKPISKEKLDILQSKFGDISKYYSDISPKQNTILKEVTPEDFMFAGADAFSRQVVKMMNDKLIAPYGMLVEKDKEIERLNRLIGRLQNEIEELKKGSAQMENPAGCANAV